MIRDALPNIIKRPGRADIVILEYSRDSLDTYKDIQWMVEEVRDARRSSFLPQPPDQDGENEHVDITFVWHLGMMTPVPEFRAKKIAYIDGYERPGEDGVEVDKEHFKLLGLPESLKPAFGIDTVVAKVKHLFPVGLQALPEDGMMWAPNT